jgi:uncharacterized damage-inducible protein DinB
MTGRTDPPLAADEAATLLGFLDFHRDTLRWKCSGLDAEQLARRHPPSGMTLGGLLKHLALVEGIWFRRVMCDEPLPPPFDEVHEHDWEWRTAADDDPETLRGYLDRAIEDSRRVTDRLLPRGLDTLSARPDHATGERYSLRWVLVHMIEEYARHNGHADLIRESVDGAVGE